MVKEKALEEKMNLLERCEVAKSGRRKRGLQEENKTGGMGEDYWVRILNWLKQREDRK